MGGFIAFPVMCRMRYETGLRRFRAVVFNTLKLLVRRFNAAVRAAVCGGVWKRHRLLMRRSCRWSPHTPQRACPPEARRTDLDVGSGALAQ